MTAELSSEEVIELLGLEPLPEEGGMWTRTLYDGKSSAIYYLLRRNDFSAMHRLVGDEIYHHYSGDPVEMLLLHPDGSHSTPVLGPDLKNGHRPQLIVPKGVWQGSLTLGDWSLVGTTMAPPYEDDDFELGDREFLKTGWPEVDSEIEKLTRE